MGDVNCHWSTDVIDCMTTGLVLYRHGNGLVKTLYHTTFVFTVHIHTLLIHFEMFFLELFHAQKSAGY